MNSYPAYYKGAGVPLPDKFPPKPHVIVYQKPGDGRVGWGRLVYLENGETKWREVWVHQFVKRAGAPFYKAWVTAKDAELPRMAGPRGAYPVMKTFAPTRASPAANIDSVRILDRKKNAPQLASAFAVWLYGALPDAKSWHLPPNRLIDSSGRILAGQVNSPAFMELRPDSPVAWFASESAPDLSAGGTLVYLTTSDQQRTIPVPAAPRSLSLPPSGYQPGRPAGKSRVAGCITNFYMRQKARVAGCRR